MRIWFGEHSGKELVHLPSSYLEWIIENVEVQTKPVSERERYRDLLSEAEEELESREENGDDEPV